VYTHRFSPQVYGVYTLCGGVYVGRDGCIGGQRPYLSYGSSHSPLTPSSASIRVIREAISSSISLKIDRILFADCSNCVHWDLLLDAEHRQVVSVLDPILCVGELPLDFVPLHALSVGYRVIQSPPTQRCETPLCASR
jgi:hypothetical protein